jgi:hypothetical protein
MSVMPATQEVERGSWFKASPGKKVNKNPIAECEGAHLSLQLWRKHK